MFPTGVASNGAADVPAFLTVALQWSSNVAAALRRSHRHQEGQVHPSVAVAVLLTCNQTMDGVKLMRGEKGERITTISPVWQGMPYDNEPRLANVAAASFLIQKCGVILTVFAVLDSVDAIPWLAVDRPASHGWQWIDWQLADESMIRFSRLAVFPVACVETVPMQGGS